MSVRSLNIFASDESVIAVKVEGPQVTSANPEERKLARALRIQKGLEKLSAVEGPVEPVPQEEDSPLNLQKLESNNTLDKRIKEAVRNLREILITNKTHELARKESEKIRRKRILKDLEDEAENAETEFDNFVEKWSDLQKFSDPIDVRRGILSIKEKCNGLIEKRDQFIDKLKVEIAASEKQFNKLERRTYDEIDGIFKKVHAYVSAIGNIFNIQFTIVQNTFNTVTNQYIQSRYDTWDDLFNVTVRKMNVVFNNKLGGYKVNDALEALVREFGEQYRARKTNLQNEVNMSRHELEHLKAQIMASRERYEYNFQILERRCEESTILRADRKRRMTKLQDIITNLKIHTHKFLTTSNNKVNKYRKDIAKLQENILKIENKADRFASLNNKIFHEIWKTSTINSKKILNRIMSIDKILHEQQMAMKWEQPEIISLDISTLSSFKKAFATVSLFNKDNKPPVDRTRNLATTDGFTITPTTEMIQALQSSNVYKNLLKKILIATSDKTGFLTENRIHELLSGYQMDDKCMVRIVNIFDSMNIKKDEDIDLLVHFFLPYCCCLNCSVTTTDDIQSVDASVSDVYTSRARFSTISYNSEGFLDLVNTVTRPRSLIKDVVFECVTSQVNLSEYYESSVESLDIAQCDAIDVESKKPLKVKKKATVLSKDKVPCQYAHNLVINVAFVSKALREFIEYSVEKCVIPTTGERMKKNRVTISRLLADDDIKNYWMNWIIHYGENSRYYKLWKGLITGFHRYLNVLQKRKILSEEVVNLRKQNELLKNSLKSYKRYHKFLPPLCATVKPATFTYQRQIRRK